jgi:hypothetical protein
LAEIIEKLDFISATIEAVGVAVKVGEASRKDISPITCPLSDIVLGCFSNENNRKRDRTRKKGEEEEEEEEEGSGKHTLR